MSRKGFMFDRRSRADRRKIDSHPLAGALAQALAAGEVDVLFQPQFGARDGAVMGAEALVRSSAEGLKDVAGDQLFAIAELSEISQELSAHIRDRALQAVAGWADDRRLSLNVAATDLADPQFVGEIAASLARAGVAPDRLTLEITEQALVRDMERSAVRLLELVAMGVRVALDDFGAGFCNFHYLKVLPLHYLKLDRSMIDGIVHDQRDLAVLRGIVAMAHALDLEVIAEGIETAAQREVIEREGCAYWQGFLGGRPMTAEGFAALEVA